MDTIIDPKQRAVQLQDSIAARHKALQDPNLVEQYKDPNVYTTLRDLQVRDGAELRAVQALILEG